MDIFGIIKKIIRSLGVSRLYSIVQAQGLGSVDKKPYFVYPIYFRNKKYIHIGNNVLIGRGAELKRTM